MPGRGTKRGRRVRGPGLQSPGATNDALAGKHGEYEMVLFLHSSFCLLHFPPPAPGTAATEAISGD